MTAARAIADRAAAHGLQLLGHAPLLAEDGLDPAYRSLVLLGPDEPGFWPLFTASAEYADGAADPLDRWSARVIGGIAEAAGGQALFPFGGPPYHPFIGWALRSGRAWQSPVGLLVHETAGLFVSFRGAIALPDPAPDAPGRGSPCDHCAAQPCRTACPVDAFGGGAYDVPACKAHLARGAGAPCRGGCLVRRACPVGAGQRPALQSAFHMEAFAPS